MERKLTSLAPAAVKPKAGDINKRPQQPAKANGTSEPAGKAADKPAAKRKLPASMR